MDKTDPDKAQNERIPLFKHFHAKTAKQGRFLFMPTIYRI